jgi:hypothetical protein
MSNANDWYIVCDKKAEQSTIFSGVKLDNYIWEK